MSEGNPELQRSYDSLGQAAVAMNMPLAQLKKWKKAGAAGFRGSRVYPDELLEWAKGREDEMEGEELGNDRESWEVRRLRMHCDDMQRKWDREDEKSWDSNEVSIAWLTHLTTARAEWLKLAADLAPRLAGRSALECEKIVRAGVELGLKKLRNNPYGERRICCPKCKEDITPKLILEKAKEDERSEENSGEKSVDRKGKNPGETTSQGGGHTPAASVDPHQKPSEAGKAAAPGRSGRAPGKTGRAARAQKKSS
jgi:hypothetical protein